MLELEQLTVNRDTPIQLDWYCQMLNASSQLYGLPISVRAIEENNLINYLEEYQFEKIRHLTNVIGGEAIKPTQNKNNIMQFQIENMGVPQTIVGHPVRRNQEVREKVDRFNPNFINSEYMYYADLSSANRIGQVVDHMQKVEGKIDAEGNPMYVVRPTYEQKVLTTNRISTNVPNIQGMNKMDRGNFFIAEKGHKFVGADINSNEGVIFFNTHCRDQFVLDYYDETGDIYLPVVSLATGIPLEEVDKEMRSAFKVGILAKMNGMGTRALGFKMESPRMAKQLNEYIESNPHFQRFMMQVDRQLAMDEPRMKAFVGDMERVITNKKDGNPRNQLINTPWQMTASILVSISVHAFYVKLMELHPEWPTMEQVIDNVRPVFHAHDEVNFMVKDEDGLPKQVAQLLDWALSLKFEDWTAFKTEPYISDYYQS